jgi:hypothetical protein
MEQTSVYSHEQLECESYCERRQMCIVRLESSYYFQEGDSQISLHSGTLLRTLSRKREFIK